jgi:hypothetical protein
MLSDVDFALIQILEIGVGERLDIVQLGQFLESGQLKIFKEPLEDHS